MSQTGLHVAEAVAVYTIRPANTPLAGLLPPAATTDLANQTLRDLTGIQRFFADHEAFEAFRAAITTPSEAFVPGERQWGDFQTPPQLARQVCTYLAANGISPRVIIEPTYGAGNFILAALDAFPEAELIYGVEIQEKYAWHLKMALLARSLHAQRPTVEIELHQDDIFTHQFTERVRQAQDVLIIGNPPWVTSAELGALEAHNLPVKRNLKALNGLDAVTGKGNFDLGEYVLLKILELFSDQRGTLAMLCKNAVIRNIVAALPRQRLKVTDIRALAIDAGKSFGAAVDASLLVMALGSATTAVTCLVGSLDHPEHTQRTFGWVDGKFVSDLAGYASASSLEGLSPLVWRQGIKHDCTPVMELTDRNSALINGDGEVVKVEASHVYDLLKSSDLRSFAARPARRKVIITQHALSDDTTQLQRSAPQLWAYLTQHRAAFDRRKSSIYRGRPPFSIFGIGDYTFLPYKVAISGFYKDPCFSLVCPNGDRPVLLDDTCYFLGFERYQEAVFTVSLLNSPLIVQFLKSVVFLDAKRPYTKDVLMRIDLARAAAQLSFDDIQALWRRVSYRPQASVKEADYEQYRRWLTDLSCESQGTQLSLGLS